MKDNNEIKAEILNCAKGWNQADDSLDGFKDAEVYESFVYQLLAEYCESKGYEVEGYPFEKRKLGETDPDYDEDYFSYDRRAKYVDTMATLHNDVFELYYFYQITFWPNDISPEEETRDQLLEIVRQNLYDVEF